MTDDVPKSLASPAAREARAARILDAHVAPLNRFVQSLRARLGKEYSIPYFDPLDGGVNADILFLLEAPGPKAVQSGFVSRNNPDETAKNFFELNAEAGIPRERTVTWNVVPWYIGTGARIRPATVLDLRDAHGPLHELLALLPAVRSVALVGRKAQCARDVIAGLRPQAVLYDVPHPSPMFINRAPGNRRCVFAALRILASHGHGGTA